MFLRYESCDFSVLKISLALGIALHVVRCSKYMCRILEEGHHGFILATYRFLPLLARNPRICSCDRSRLHPLKLLEWLIGWQSPVSVPARGR